MKLPATPDLRLAAAAESPERRDRPRCSSDCVGRAGGKELAIKHVLPSTRDYDSDVWRRLAWLGVENEMPSFRAGRDSRLKCEVATDMCSC